jgi:hypothetical protein
MLTLDCQNFPQILKNLGISDQISDDSGDNDDDDGDDDDDQDDDGSSKKRRKKLRKANAGVS